MTGQKRLAQTYTHPGLVRAIQSPVELFTGIYNTRKSITLNATWDTGATRSVIAPEIFQQLNLKIIDITFFYAVNSAQTAETALVSLRFPNGITIEDLRVTVCPITPSTKMLIGMDIISLMDFAITNGGNQTQFSFALPPFHERIDFENELAINWVLGMAIPLLFSALAGHLRCAPVLSNSQKWLNLPFSKNNHIP
jgi:hypothetical protein